MTLARQLIAERRARLSAERLLILKQAELSLANQKLGLRAEPPRQICARIPEE